jgi:mannose-6-phosphate isomerase-like protein (cupin superfamily)
MSQIAGKVWGQTELIFSNSALEFHRIEARANTFCSKHQHKHKWNGFFVESGQLLIRVWKNNYDLVDETTLNAGDFTAVAPGEFHQFQAIADTVAFELYWAAALDPDDIQRETLGGQTQTNK